MSLRCFFPNLSEAMHPQSFDIQDEKFPLETELKSMAPAALKGKAVLASILIFAFWEESFALALCSAGILLAVLVRYILVSEWVYFRESRRVKMWNQWFDGLALAKGFFWGIMNPIVVAEFGTASLTTLTVLLATSGVAASSIPSLGPRPYLARIFVSLVCLPIILYLPLFGELHREYMIPILFFVYWAYCWRQISVASNKFSHSVQQAELLKSVVLNIPISMTCRTLDGEKKFSFINKAAEKVWGLKPEHIGRSPEQVFTPEVAMTIQSQDGTAREYFEPVRFPEFRVRVDGEEKVLRKTTVYLRDARLILDISEDISHMKKAEKEISALQSVHFQAAKMATLGEMAAGVAHEINNPLAIITGRAEHIRRLAHQQPSLQTDVDSSVERILITTKRISKIVQGLLAFSKTGDSDAPVHTTAQQIVQFALNLVQKKFELGQVRLDVLPFEDVVITCQEQRVAQCLINLLNNAYDAVHGKPEGWVELMVQDLGEDLGFSVTDSGTPIPPEVRKKMMLPFFTTKEVGKGMGLGLSVVKGVVEEHSGEFYLNEECPHTQFVMIIPKQTAHQIRAA